MKQSGNKHKSEEEETKMGRIFCILTGYLCGSFLTAELVAQERIGKSAFEIGTGNPGMANLAVEQSSGLSPQPTPALAASWATTIPSGTGFTAEKAWPATQLP